MKIRKNIWPKTLADFASMTFILAIVPLLYWFEIWIVLPALYEVGSPSHLFHFLFGHFLMINIVGNFTYTVLCDTSTRHLTINTGSARAEDGWRYCGACESLSPPRSWHCATCNVCILKRDHHCLFTGCCVGHLNHRYFLMFVFYLFVATLYAFVYNNYFLWYRLKFDSPASLLKIIFPLAIFVFGLDPSAEQIYLIFYLVTGVGACFTAALGYYHADLAASGCVANERAKGVKKYDLGWRRNVADVMGERWYVAWILPYVKSDLSQDGVVWRTGQRESFKTR